MTMVRFQILMLFLICFHFTNGKQTKLSPAQLKEDFEIFEGSIREAHAGLFWYNDSAAIDQKLNIINSAIQQEKSQTEFHRMLQGFYAGINCGHSWMSQPSDFASKRDSGTYHFPFEIFFDGFSATISRDYTTDKLLNPGDEIIKIDGFTISEIFETIYEFIPSDGINITSKNRIIAGQFAAYYQQYIQMKDEVVLSIKDDRNSIRNITLGCISKSTYDEEVKAANSTATKDLLSFEILNDNTGILKIKTFSKGWIKYQQKVSFKKFLKETFETIKDRNISRLVLDLRFNGGGDDGLGALLTTFLIPKEFRYFEKMELSTRKFSYLKYSDTKGLKLVSLLIKKSKEKPNTYRWTHHQPLKKQKPNKLVFDGQLIVLTNGRTFSTAADVCAILHANKRGIFSGEEVGGGYYGNSSAITMDIQLPNSGVKFWIPLVRYTNFVDFPAFIGHGVIPDYKIPFTYQDYASKEDLLLLKSMKLFENN